MRRVTRVVLLGVGRGFSFADEALANLAVYGVTPAEVWKALSGTRRVIRHLGDDLTVVCAATRRGRRLAVLVAEAVDGWDVLSARDLSDGEAKRYEEAITGWGR
jgi:hypothetical protein